MYDKKPLNWPGAFGPTMSAIMIKLFPHFLLIALLSTKVLSLDTRIIFDNDEICVTIDNQIRANAPNHKSDQSKLFLLEGLYQVNYKYADLNYGEAVWDKSRISIHTLNLGNDGQSIQLAEATFSISRGNYKHKLWLIPAELGLNQMTIDQRGTVLQTEFGWNKDYGFTELEPVFTFPHLYYYEGLTLATSNVRYRFLNVGATSYIYMQDVSNRNEFAQVFKINGVQNHSELWLQYVCLLQIK